MVERFQLLARMVFSVICKKIDLDIQTETQSGLSAGLAGLNRDGPTAVGFIFALPHLAPRNDMIVRWTQRTVTLRGAHLDS